VRDHLDPAARATFDRAYAAAYSPARDLVAEIYDEVDAGTELRSVILAERRLAARPMAPIAGSPMWTHSQAVHERRGENLQVGPFTAGTFIATMMAQVDEFVSRGHPWSEIVNESIIEATDSLLPICTRETSPTWWTTALAPPGSVPGAGARGSRRRISRSRFRRRTAVSPAGAAELTAAFDGHLVHEALAAVAKLRPPVDISVV
jgi:ketol-acid reductoisomerase